MQYLALPVLILLAMVTPVAIVCSLGLALRGVSSLDLSVFDFYILVATPLVCAVHTAAEVLAAL